MEIRRRRESQRSDQKQLARSGLEKIDSAHNLGDLHSGIIDNNCKLICGDVVAAPDDEVAEILTRYERLRTLTLVGETDRFAVGYSEAPVHAFRFGVTAGLGNSVA